MTNPTAKSPTAACICAAVVCCGALLTGCAQTIPSPEMPLPKGNFQIRLHQTQGGQAASRANVSLGVQAFGCTLTIMGKPPKGVEGYLEAGNCKAEIK